MHAVKKWLLAVLVTIGFGVTAQSASAQIYPYMKNDTGVPVTISNVSWTGSYSPRIEGTAAANTEAGGTHRFANPNNSRYTSLSFKASFTDPYTTTLKSCYFAYDFRSDTQTYYSSSATRYDGLPSCTLMRQGSSIFNFAIGLGN